MAKKIKTITICSSASFYKDVIAIQKQLRKKGYKVLIPKIAAEMQKRKDFDVSHYKTWLTNSADYHKKTVLMHGHFKKVKKADAILVVNKEKKGIEGYIGGNVLLEMFLAYMDKKPIYILYDIANELPLIEEILGFSPLFLHGSLEHFA